MSEKSATSKSSSKSSGSEKSPKEKPGKEEKPGKGDKGKGKKEEPPPSPPKVHPKKPYEVIQAFFNGNEVKIKMPKSLAKPPALTPSQQKLQQFCTCEDDESVCSDTCGKGHAANPDANKLNFQIPDDICEAFTNRTRLNSELVYSKKEHHDVLCNTCGKGGDHKKDDPGALDVHKSVKGHKDVYVLRLGKQSDEPARKGLIQVELKTPRHLARPIPAYHSCQEVQCDGEDLPAIYPCKACKPIGIPKNKKSRKRSCCR